MYSFESKAILACIEVENQVQNKMILTYDVRLRRYICGVDRFSLFIKVVWLFEMIAHACIPCLQVFVSQNCQRIQKLLTTSSTAGGGMKIVTTQLALWSLSDRTIAS